MTEAEAQQYANFKILNAADAYIQLLESSGWQQVYKLHCAWLEKYRDIARHVDLGNPTAALAALHQWQVAEDLLEEQAKYINSMIDKATEIRGTNTLEDALMMEKVRHEHGEPGNTADPTGY